MRVSEIMNKAYVVDDFISLKEAAKLMSEKNIGCLIILAKGKITGIITERDIMKNVNNLGEKVSKVMSKNVITIGKKDTVEDAADLMAKNKIKKLPVVEKGELAGIITATDIIAHSGDLGEDFFFD